MQFFARLILLSKECVQIQAVTAMVHHCPEFSQPYSLIKTRVLRYKHHHTANFTKYGTDQSAMFIRLPARDEARAKI